MNTYKFERCEPESPDRCQGLSHGGNAQCSFRAVPESRYCPRHGGNKSNNAKAKEAQRLYLLSEWRSRFEKQADAPKIKTLREEIAILRMTLEMKLNHCKDEEQLMMRSGQITEMVREIQKTVTACQKLEEQLGSMLDKTQAQVWIMRLSEIIGLYISDPEVLTMISEDMITSLEEMTK